MDSDNRLFGRALQDARKKAGLQQADVAAKVGLKSSALSRYERGDSLPSVVMAGKLALAVGVSLDVLLGGAASDNVELNRVVGLIKDWSPERLSALAVVLVD